MSLGADDDGDGDGDEGDDGAGGDILCPAALLQVMV